jgi:hypothetical protein
MVIVVPLIAVTFPSPPKGAWGCVAFVGADAPLVAEVLSVTELFGLVVVAGVCALAILTIPAVTPVPTSTAAASKGAANFLDTIRFFNFD